MSAIDKIIDPCTFKIKDKWEWGILSGYWVRVVGLYPPDNQREIPRITAEMERRLLGRDLKIIAPHFVQAGRILVAEVTIEKTTFQECFGKRYVPQPPRTRTMDPGDVRNIRRVNGYVPSQWTNTLRESPSENKPSLGNFDFPTDPWLPNYKESIARIDKIFCDDRDRRSEDYETIKNFLTNRTERVLLLFGSCGSGKSWFLRHFLYKNRIPNLDYAIIDVSDYPEGPDFETRLHLRLNEILGNLVNKKKGGLRYALKELLIREVEGIFPGEDFESEKIKIWCQDYLSNLSKKDIVTYNTIRLSSYANSEKDLVIVIDNLDGFSDEEQEKMFLLVVNSVTQQAGIHLIVSLRPTTAFFAARCKQTLQHLHRTYHISKLNLRSLIRNRLIISETGKDISSIQYQDNNTATGFFTLYDILNYFVNSESEKVINDLSQNDVRQYIRLFRRLVYSDEVKGMSNIEGEYYCVSALMLKPNERFSEDNSFIVNVFDNDHPEEIGNALIRWRVLEYFLKNYQDCEGESFKYYFLRLGYDLRRVNEIIQMFNAAGIITLHRLKLGVEARLTPTANRYKILLSNLWYCIAIKTGMNIDEHYILSGYVAKKAAQEHGFSLPQNAEWVSDDGFLTFLVDEEQLEEIRITANPSKIDQFETNYRLRGPTSIHHELWHAYAFQRRQWEKKRNK